MARRQLLVLVALVGYASAFIPVLWARYDMTRIPRSLWRYVAPRPRELWRGLLVAGYVCGGWPGLLVTLVWRFSPDRSMLREEWDHLHRRNVEARPPPAAPGPAPSAEREIVLADYEEEVDVQRREDAPPAPS
jgi:hypothetical protein